MYLISKIILTGKTPKRLFSIQSEVKNFNEIPGTVSLPLIGTLHQYFPVVGRYKGIKLHHENYDKFKRYGPIVKENLTSYNPPLLNLFFAEDFETIFRNESENPSRVSHLALQEYRLRKKDVYATGGLLPTNNEEWWRLRRSFQKGLSSPKSVVAFLSSVNDITMEWIETIETKIEKNNNDNDFLKDLWRIFLERCVVLNHRFKTFSQRGSNDDALKLVHAALETNSLVACTDVGFKLWKKMETKSYKSLAESQDYMERVVTNLLRSNTMSDQCLLSHWKKLNDITDKDILAMVIDFFLAGIDTSANTSSFLLYYVSQHGDIQAKLYEECCRLMPHKSSPVTEDVLNGARFAKAVLKENLRLRPISIGIGRLLTKDIIIRGYNIPKGVNVLTNNQVACRFESNFHKPLEFIPERWIREDPLYKQPHPFLLLPFGFGPRACIARRLAEQNMLVMLLKVVRNFHLEWKGGELDSENHLIQKPDKEIQLKFSRR